jgi:hypothetical protein
MWCARGSLEWAPSRWHQVWAPLGLSLAHQRGALLVMWFCWCTIGAHGQCASSTIYPWLTSGAPTVIDEDIPSIDTPAAPTTEHIQGPITRARAKQLNYQVLSFLGTLSYIHENMMLPESDVFVTLRNYGPSMDERDKH